ncbi:UbiA family prenyltransferase [Methylobrevis albus]|uniref:UbiA family prenyltransferase n=1 Tax=Methylobrevis albus TaxID=2793297 RepID=A0A931HYP2_9HYPH|nr:UbiA family prenyltransferase [Methylobrevis albus]MBH0237122.1 UbiA family prenyltransferase [Methylobrevis albus]
MDARVGELTTIPCCVDLDGTLVATDTLHEGVLALLKLNPLFLFLLPYWLLHGKARLKREVALRTRLDPALLPYRPEVLAALHDCRANGRRIYLTTGAHQTVAEGVAKHLGIFDGVFSTDGDVNLTSHAKRELLVAKFGEAGFDYFGNSREDIEIFEHARQVTVVAPDRTARGWSRRNASGLIDHPAGLLKPLIKAIRVHQWMKNVLIAVPLILAHQHDEFGAVLAAVTAFFAFSFAASAVYILNDLMDLSSDRRHATKRRRPFAAGTLSVSAGIKTAVVLVAASIGLATLLPPLFGVALGVYAVITTAYSLSLKRMLLVDVITLASLYTLRVLAGAAATGAGVSFWLLSFSMFFFLGLALVKRYVELSGQEKSEVRIEGRGYRPADIDVIMTSGLAASFVSTLVLALYIDSAEVRQLYGQPWLLWPLCPMVLYITMRIWVLARREEMHDDPVVFILKDWRSQIVIALGAVLVFTATVG